MVPESLLEAPTSSARPTRLGARERQQVARRLLREASLELARLRRIRGAYKRTARRIAGARRRLALAAGLLGVPLAGAAGALTPIFVSPFPIPEVVARASPALADIDGDGDLDAFVGEFYGNTIFFANTGTASAPAFAAPSVNPFGLVDVGREAAPAFVDIDGDGDLDAFMGEYLGGKFFFENTGTPSAPAFAAPATNPFGLTAVQHYASPTFADLDGDGDLDAFEGVYTGVTLFFRNTGTASAPAFAAVSLNPFGITQVEDQSSPTFADIDGDGDLDAFVGDYTGETRFFANTGTAIAPSFAAGSFFPFGLAQVAMNSSPAFADLDGDGDLDAFVGERGGKTIYFANTGTANAPAFAAPNPIGPTDVGALASPAFADLDADGDLDGFVGHFLGNSFFFANTGTVNAPAFAVGTTPSFGLSDVGDEASPAFADIDADGDLDAFVGQVVNTVVFFANVGTASAPAFGTPTGNPFGLALVGGRQRPAFADIDADGDIDAFTGTGGGTTKFFRNTGTATAPAFAASSPNAFGLADVGANASPAFVDLDGDGDLDAFVGEAGGNTIYFANTGTATAPAFAAPATNPFGLADAGERASPAFADLDGDGDLDAFVGEAYGRTVYFENVELGPGTCADGRDNDFDGQIDSPSDPGCANADDPNERSSKQCDNGLDDDGDGKIDWRGDATGDPQCVSLTDNSEAAPPPAGCGLGPELLLLGPLLAAARRRLSSASPARREP
jgi:hypothetical protein